MLNKSCIDFLKTLSSKEPVPGGGGATAYVGALGMALGNMVGNLTIGKEKYKEVEKEIIEIVKEGEALIKELENLVNKDAKVFIPLSKAYKLPKNTKQEKEYKEKVMEDALKKASLVPLEIAKCIAKTIDLHEVLAYKGTKIALSDVGVGVLFCKSALEASKLNVFINTSMMKNKEIKDMIENEINDLVFIYAKKAEKIYKHIEKQIIKGEI